MSTRVGKGRFSLQFGEHKGDIRIAHRDAALLGIDMSSLSIGGQGTDPRQTLVQGGRADFDVGTLSLKLTVPQSQ